MSEHHKARAAAARFEALIREARARLAAAVPANDNRPVRA